MPTVSPIPGKELPGTVSERADRAQGNAFSRASLTEKGIPGNENICMRQHPREVSPSAGVFGPSNPAGKQVPATRIKTIIHLLSHVFLHKVSFAMHSDTLPLPEANLLLKLFTVGCEGEDEAC